MTFACELPVMGRTRAHSDIDDVVDHLREASRLVREQDLRNVVNAGQGHIGGEFSVTDILVTLYLHVANIDPDNIAHPDRDRIILSKGHAANALYTTFAVLGLIPADELATFVQPMSRLNGHPNRREIAGIEANTGPLGHGLPIAVGDAIAAKLDGSRRRVFVITGDGELQEGSNWEALMAAAQFKLDNLTVIVDRNHLQQGATTEETNDLSPLDEKAHAFGATVRQVNAHDHRALVEVLSMPSAEGRPTFVIAHSHKGYPISFMRDNQPWHHKLPSSEEAAAALRELEEWK